MSLFALRGGRQAHKLLRLSPAMARPAIGAPTRQLGPSASRSRGVQTAPSFPCVDANESRGQKIMQERQPKRGPPEEIANLPTPPDSKDPEGPEVAYSNVVTGYQTYHHADPFKLEYGGELAEFDIAYETWGELNADRTNAILIHTGLSASSHAKSSAANPADGWWEKFIGPGKSIDTNRFFVICTNVLGGCYGSTGPSSIDPATGSPYATTFPILSLCDMVQAQFHLLTNLGIEKVYASVGGSMGGMQSIAAAYLNPDRVGKVVSISGTARSSPAAVAMRHAQRSVLMADPNWKRGFYYDDMPPHTGMKLARQIATITYRSGPEWEQRFGRQRREGKAPSPEAPPVLCPDFLIETYLDHQGEQFCLKFDANSLLYISKSTDLFDMSDVGYKRLAAEAEANGIPAPTATQSKDKKKKKHISTLSSTETYLPALRAGLSHHMHPTLIIGVQSDILFPIEQQRELAECLRSNGNSRVVYYELNQPWGHDTFLLDVPNVGGAVRGFLEESDL